jgi:hypothetical protein
MAEQTIARKNPGPNRVTYLDSIEFFQKCHWKNSANYRELYLEKGFSAAQIGEKLGIPKQTVLSQLKRDGIRKGGYNGELANPTNYRLAYAPYGFSKKNGRLVPNKAELKICRLVIQLKNDSNLSFRGIRQPSVAFTNDGMGNFSPSAKRELCLQH